MREFSIGKRLIEGYLHQPYSWFLSRHSADLGKTILSDVAQIIGGGIFPFLEIIARSCCNCTYSIINFSRPKTCFYCKFFTVFCEINSYFLFCQKHT